MDVFKGCKNEGKILEYHLEKEEILKYARHKEYFMADSMYDSKIIHEKLRDGRYKPLIEQNRRGIKNEEKKIYKSGI